jgi:hypothetical protein
MKLKSKYLKQILTVAFLTLLAGCTNTLGSKPTNSKQVIGGELLFEVSSQKVGKMIESFGVGNTMKVYGLKVYKIPYITKDSQNNNIHVSGLLSVPIGKKETIGLVSFSHGTITLNDSAPTVKAQKTKQPSTVSLFFSATGTGFATLEADYIGYGTSSKNHHPYMIKNTLANTSVDFIKAVKIFAKKNDIKLNKHLYVTGYSEGGYVSMAMLKKLESQHIHVDAAAPMAGAYDLNYMARAVLGWENESLKSYAMTYTLLTLNAYAKKYGKEIKGIIKEPYASQMDTLLDGKHTFGQIDSALPLDEVGKNGLLTQAFLTQYKTNPNHWFRKALKENSIFNWKPKTKLRLIHCQGDDQVPYTISVRTLQSFIRNGARDTSLITLDNFERDDKKWSHNKCFFSSMLWTTNWFTSVEENERMKGKK